VALVGERFDGHDYVDQAIAAGAAAVLVNEKDRHATSSRAPTDAAVIAVTDPRLAFRSLGAYYRCEFPIPSIAVAGSNGKTTTKDLIASVLGESFSVLASEASFNNDIGVPLTLLKLNASHGAAVLEAGTNHPGELAPLVTMIAPTYGVITSIGGEHLEFFGDLDGVSREEGMLAELLPSSGKLFLNGDDPWCLRIATRASAPVLRVGLSPANDWCASNVRVHRDGTEFFVIGPGFDGTFRMNLLGRHQVVNALFAIALGVEFGLSTTQIENGLLAAQPAKMRLQLSDSDGVLVLDDSYNANVDSVIAALRTLQELPTKGRRIVVLGDMAELGDHSEAAHVEIGLQAASTGVGQLFAIGKWAQAIGRGARKGGLTRIFEFSDVDTAAAAVKSFVRQGDLVLVKASRASRLERVSILLRGELKRP